MRQVLITAREAAQRLGIATATLYHWLQLSNAGAFVIRGQLTTINYFQGGRRGQGRILIDETELERLKECMRVVHRGPVSRRPPARSGNYPGINVPLGRPDA
ncbi:MAG: DNA-binding protein [Gemmataceae bacterium]